MITASLAAPSFGGRPITVSPAGSDQATGTADAPYRTVRKALSESQAGDTVKLAAGDYDCEDFSTEINHPLTIVGEGKGVTVLRHIGRLKFTNTLHVSKLTFADAHGTVLMPYAGEGEKLEDVLIENCAFDNVPMGIDTDDASRGVIKNFTVRDCDFRDMKGVKVYGIAITSGEISNITVTDNTFHNLESSRKICAAIVVGSNRTRGTTKEIVISGNRMDGIAGSTRVVDGSGAETHGILAYGENIRIVDNAVKGMNSGRDHEAIYMKASHSLIADNVVEECASDDGDICAKGGAEAGDNVIRGNRVFGQGKGRAIYVNGGVVVKDNYVKKPNGNIGIRIYAFNKPVVVEGNYVEVPEESVRINDGLDTTIVGNTLISYKQNAIDLTACKVKKVENNNTHEGPNPPAGWDRQR